MRLLIVTSLYPSGNGNWVAEQVRSLREEGVDVDVIFFNTKATRWHYARSIPGIARALRAKEYDVVHTHHTYTMLDVLAARRLSSSHVPIILTNHEGEILDYGRRAVSWHPTSWLRNSRAVKRYAARRADMVIFVSSALAKGLAFDGSYEVIPCGVDLDKFRPMDRAQCRRRVGVAEDPMMVFFPGDPQDIRKRFPLAQEAYAIVRREVPNAILLTAGGIPADEMPFYYAAADVVVQTSFFEASPTVVKEALACEVPVVSTDAGDTREVIGDTPNCAVCAEDPGELALHLLGARGRRARGARERLIAKQLTLPQVARRLISVYARMADQHHTVSLITRSQDRGRVT